jgi:hypothetical protein
MLATLLNFLKKWSDGQDANPSTFCGQNKTNIFQSLRPSHFCLQKVNVNLLTFKDCQIAKK